MAAELILHEGAAPSTPGTNKATLYLDTSNRICFKSEDGNIYILAVLEKAQTFTQVQTIAPIGTGTNAIDLSMPASTTGFAIRVLCNAINALTGEFREAVGLLTVSSRNLGNNVAGPALQVQRNTSAGTEGPAAGTLACVRAAGGARFIWPDAGSDWRTHTAAPTGSSGSPSVADNAGTVIGTQTSFAGSKNFYDELSSLEEVLQRVRAGAAAVQRFMYKERKFNAQVFEGVVTDLAPEYGMDRDAEHPQGKSLNEIQILGDLLRVVANLVERVEALEAKN